MRVGLIIVLMSLCIAQTPAPVTFTLEFSRLQQGEIGIIRLTGENIERVRAAFLDHQFVLYETAQEEWTGLIPVPIDAPTGMFRLSVLVIYEDGTEDYVGRDVQVVRGAFASVDITIAGTLSELLDPEVLLDEFAILDDYLLPITPPQAWVEAGLLLPERPPNARFGAYRHFNSTIWQRHTGVDFAAPVGTPILATAAGEVVYSGALPIRGDYVLIDHGGGLYSGYAHMSARLVEIGDHVAAGDTIGAVGNSGRSTGSHLHWEMALGGVWIDPLWLANWLYESTNS